MSGELTDIENLNIFCINFMIPSNLSANKMKEEVFMQHKKALSLILAILLLSIMAGAQAFGQEAEKEIPQPTIQTIYVDGQNVQMEVYSVNGSDYVKLSDLANALNLNVYWDNGIHVQSSTAGTAPAAGITTPPAPVTTAPADGEEAAIQAALTHAGVNRNETMGMRVKTDWEFSGKIYEVEFHVGRTEYSYDIDADTFEILKWEVDTDD